VVLKDPLVLTKTQI